ncbi:MAG TPA: isochorismatase family protein [Edaphobacter sp.]|nr:isochorismatase family protein [Edaphobacter sp.]
MLDKTFAWDQLSSETAQVLFCDLQKDIVRHSETTPARALSSAAGALLQLAKLFSLPTIISVVPDGNNPPQVIAELSGIDGFAPEMLRATASLFGDAATTQAIARSSRRVLIVAGFMMEAVVLNTVLDALALGYEVIVAVDACGSPSARTEQAVLRQMESAGAITTSVVSIGTKLSPDFSTDIGKQMFEIVQGIKAA